MITLAVDPDYTKSAVSVWEDGIFQEVCYCKTQSDAILNFIDKRSKEHKFSMACEDQYLGRNPSTFEKLIFARHLWEILSYIHHKNVGVFRINPKTWQAFCLGKFEKGKSKQVSVSKYKDITGHEIPQKQHDLADAYHIGNYVIQNYDSIPIVDL